jgi:hypothetical protein
MGKRLVKNQPKEKIYRIMPDKIIHMPDPPASDWLLLRKAGNTGPWPDGSPVLINLARMPYIIAGTRPGTLFVSAFPYAVKGDVDDLAVLLNATRYEPA